MSRAKELKEQGNAYFATRNFSEAINCYTKAIICDPNIETFYTNRALCYLKLKQWDHACQDCQRAIEFNPSHIKAHFFRGQALLELEYFDEAIASLMKANDLAKLQRQNFGDDITYVLRMARKKKFDLAEGKRVQQEIELQTELNILLEAERDRQILASDEMKHDQINEEFAKKIQLLNQIFETVDERRQKRTVPDVFCSRIHFEIMRDPVITPSGHSYERNDIEQHLNTLGNFDPITRKDLTVKDLIPNLALKEIIDNFLIENPWAEEY